MARPPDPADLLPMRTTSLWLTAVLGSVAFGCRPPDISITETPIRITKETPGYGEPVVKAAERPSSNMVFPTPRLPYTMALLPSVSQGR